MGIKKYQNLLDRFVQKNIDLLGDNLIGIYLHGSAVTGCFNADDLSALLGALGLTALHIDSTTKDMAKQKLRDWFGDYDQSEVENDN